MRCKFLFSMAVLLAATSCRDENLLCGDPPAPVWGVRYLVVDAATGHDWFAASGRPAGDSLRLLTLGAGSGLLADSTAAGFVLGPVPLYSTDGGNGVLTHYLRLSAQDVDTVQVRLQYGNSSGPCQAGLQRLDFAYNSHPIGTYRSTDSLYQFTGYGGLVRLRKR